MGGGASRGGEQQQHHEQQYHDRHRQHQQQHHHEQQQQAHPLVEHVTQLVHPLAGQARRVRRVHRVPVRAHHEHLLDDGLRRQRRVAQRAVVRHAQLGDVAPAQHPQPQVARILLKRLLGRLPQTRVRVQEELPDQVLPGLRQLDARLAVAPDHVLPRHARHELVRHAEQAAGAVAGARVLAARAAVLHALDHLARVGHDRALLLALDVDRRPHPAVVVLELRVVQPHGGRRAQQVWRFAVRAAASRRRTLVPQRRAAHDVRRPSDADRAAHRAGPRGEHSPARAACDEEQTLRQARLRR